MREACSGPASKPRLKPAGTTDENDEKFGALSGAFRKIRMRAQSYAAVYFPFVALLGELSTAIVLVVGAHWVADRAITAGAVSAFLIYLGLVFAPFQQLAQVFDGYQHTTVGADRIADLLSTPTEPEVASDANAGSRITRGEIVVDGLSYAYEDGTPALENVSLRIGAGQTVAIVGETGSGKTTFLRLLARFYEPSDGGIRIDGTDLSEIPTGELRHSLALMPQEQHFFSGTIADNIRYGMPNASRDDVERVAHETGADRVIREMPLGFHQPITGDHALPGSEGQLVSISRALLGDPSVLLLDEPTATLDSDAEQMVLRAMRDTAARRTSVIVTHRLASAKLADSVVVVRDGRVVEQGAPDELMQKQGAFAQMESAEATPHNVTALHGESGGEDAAHGGGRLAAIAPEDPEDQLTM